MNLAELDQAREKDNYDNNDPGCNPLALKAIQRDTYVPEKNSQLVSRFTQEKIDVADVAAVSDEEKNVTSALNTVYRAQLNLNQHKDAIAAPTRWALSVDATQYTQRQWNDITAAQLKLQLAELPMVKALSGQLDTCFSDFDASLRARSTGVPASCVADQK
jgi:uncharacterized protein YhdP